ncbi:WYL domain-containing protein [Clostridium botulinum]|uniref:helix-turn-helix transcriptional regulator n=1 Tax=Clostridium botulinum TaxID=1491 RepID=UPI0013F79F75|nr:WYL domain-containing protein [Clostridium botulinum]MBN1065542.1 WYL domain-containing protein [Clostridium botulinum]NFF82625.1 WYL domain-containing protein [Clostridium botulinum]NFO14037.1 WYL domain-containing protein [Clostridium botulinum]
MNEEKQGKINRVLSIYEKLIIGEIINKKQLTNLFNVNEKTIQRDIEDIRVYLSNNIESKGIVDVKYRRDKKGYSLSKKEEFLLNKDDVLAVSKVLLESRAFNKEEMNHLIRAILNQIDIKQRNYVKELIGNELLNFQPLKHNDKLLSKIWDLSEFIRHKEVLEISYVKANGDEVKRKIKPVGIIFSEFYFYLIAYFNDLPFDDPVVFRIDRIREYKAIEDKFCISEDKRFEDGEFRKKVQFMYSGKLMKVRFEFIGQSLEAILDRLPTAKVIDKYDDKYLIEAEVFGKGIIMWILSQGSKIKVISPDNLVKEIACEVKKISELYKID